MISGYMDMTFYRFKEQTSQKNGHLKKSYVTYGHLSFPFGTMRNSNLLPIKYKWERVSLVNSRYLQCCSQVSQQHRSLEWSREPHHFHPAENTSSANLILKQCLCSIYNYTDLSFCSTFSLHYHILLYWKDGNKCIKPWNMNRSMISLFPLKNSKVHKLLRI